MDSRKEIFKQTAVVAAGEGICTALMLGFFALLSRFDLSVFLGGLVGCLVTVGNFFFLAISAALAADRAQNQDVDTAKKLMKSSQTMRFAALAGILLVCGFSKQFNLIALVLPLLFLRPVLMVAEFFRKKGD